MLSLEDASILRSMKGFWFMPAVMIAYVFILVRLVSQRIKSCTSVFWHVPRLGRSQINENYAGILLLSS